MFGAELVMLLPSAAQTHLLYYILYEKAFEWSVANTPNKRDNIKFK